MSEEKLASSSQASKQRCEELIDYNTLHFIDTLSPCPGIYLIRRFLTLHALPYPGPLQADEESASEINKREQESFRDCRLFRRLLLNLILTSFVLIVVAKHLEVS